MSFPHTIQLTVLFFTIFPAHVLLVIPHVLLVIPHVSLVIPHVLIARYSCMTTLL